MRAIDPSEFAALKAEVEALRQTVGTPHRSPVPASRPGVRSRLRRVATAGALTALLVAMPMLVSASHQFSDVPTSNTFHASIENLYGARLTGGCSAGKFCPADNVTRGQMAAFLNRSLGRAVGDSGVAVGWWSELADTVAGEVTLKTGGGTGGTAYVWVHGDFTAWTDEAGVCPCEIELYLTNSETLEASVSMYEMIGTESVEGYRDGAASVSYLFAVPSGMNVTYYLNAAIYPTLTPSPEIAFDTSFAYELTAMYLPFDWDGTNPTIPEVKPLAPAGHRGGR